MLVWGRSIRLIRIVFGYKGARRHYHFFKMKTDLHKRAVRLRKQGWSHLEIAKFLQVSKSTSSLWTKDVALPFSARELLSLKEKVGREKGRAIRSIKVKRRNEGIARQAIESLRSFTVDKQTARILAAMLYWGEGSKTSNRITFTNSDSKLVQVFMDLFSYGFDIQKEKFSAVLHLHSYHDVERVKRFWSKVCGIAVSRIHIYLKKNSGKVKRPGYMGCIAITYSDVVIFQQLSQIYTNFEKVVIGGLSVPSAQTSPKRLERV